MPGLPHEEHPPGDTRVASTMQRDHGVLRNRRVQLVAVPLVFACALVAALSLGIGGREGGKGDKSSVLLSGGGVSTRVSTPAVGAQHSATSKVRAVKPAGVLHSDKLQLKGGISTVSEVARVLATLSKQRHAGSQQIHTNAKLGTSTTTSTKLGTQHPVSSSTSLDSVPASEVAKVLADITARANDKQHASSGEAKAAAPTGAKAHGSSFQQTEKAAEIEAEKDAIAADDGNARNSYEALEDPGASQQKDASTADDGNSNNSYEALEDPSASQQRTKRSGGEKATSEEAKYDTTGLKAKKVKKVKKPKLSKGVLEAMKTGLEAGWAEDAAAKEIAAKQAAAYYANLRKRMLLLDERHELKEKREMAERRNHTTSEDDQDLLNALDKVYASNEPKAARHAVVASAAAKKISGVKPKQDQVQRAASKEGQKVDVVKKALEDETNMVLSRAANTSPIDFINQLF